MKFSKILLFLIFSTSSVGYPAASESCVKKSLDHLKQLNPSGFLAFLNLKEKNDFLQYLECRDSHTELAVAVHESIHSLTGSTATYQLISGKKISMVDGTQQYFPPKNISKELDLNDHYVKTYLLGKASSKDYFLILLDELNAYTHGAVTAVELISLQQNRTGFRDGLAALMYFVLVYFEHAQKFYPNVYKSLLEQDKVKLVQTLWSQAETALKRSCPYSRLGMNDKKYRNAMKQTNKIQAISSVLGRKPDIPQECPNL